MDVAESELQVITSGGVQCLGKNGGLLNEQQVPVGQFSPSHSGMDSGMEYGILLESVSTTCSLQIHRNSHCGYQ